MYKKFLAVLMLSLCGGATGYTAWLRFWASIELDPFSKGLLNFIIVAMVALFAISMADVFREFHKPK